MQGITDIDKQVQLTARCLARYKAQGKKIFATSSFQTHSIPMLHIISRLDKTIPIYFINTGYHFPATLHFRDMVTNLLGLQLVEQMPLVPKSLQRDRSGNLYFASDPDYCCYLNKIQPLEPILVEMDVWINGIRADQTANRSTMQVEQNAPNGVMRFHPMLYWNGKMIYEYIRKYSLPRHPLDGQGYLSVGCEPCTRKSFLGDERDSRWFGLCKTECGLNTDLAGRN